MGRTPPPPHARHRRALPVGGQVGPAFPARRRIVRHLTPLVVGAAAMVVATTLGTVTRPVVVEQAAPELSAALAARDAASPRPTITMSPEVDPPSVEPAAAPSAPAPTATATAKARPNETSTAARPSRPSSDAGGPGVTVTAGGVQAGVARGWTKAGGDEFNGSMSDQWVKYDSVGHAGNGRRSPSAVTVRDGMLVIRGDSDGTTGGMVWAEGQRYGKWEVRARFPAGDSQYHPVLLLWPTDVEWPSGGEIDFAETHSAAQDVSFFLHYGSSNSQLSAARSVDLTQWHNYAVEWTPRGVTGYLDGSPWFSSSDPGTLPPGKMQAAVQLDYFPGGGPPRPTEMDVDWVRIYR